MPLHCFNRDRNKADGLHAYCKRCQSAYARERRGPEARRREVERRYNLPEHGYAAMLEAQGGVCAICQQADDGEALAVDHDHRCCPGNSSCGRCVRGLLCSRCNKGLGSFRDRDDVLLAAVSYLRSSARVLSDA